MTAAWRCPATRRRVGSAKGAGRKGGAKFRRFPAAGRHSCDLKCTGRKPSRTRAVIKGVVSVRVDHLGIKGRLSLRDCTGLTTLPGDLVVKGLLDQGGRERLLGLPQGLLP